MEKIKIAFFDTKPYDKKSFTAVNEDFGYEIKYFKNHLNPDTVSLAKNYDFVCAFVNDDLSGEVIMSLAEYNIGMVAMRCAGYNNVDLKTAYQNIHITRVPAYSPYAVAEHTVALMLSLNRKTHKAYYRIRDNNFTINGFLGFDMHGKTAGVIGTGKIGRLLIDILNGFGMKVLAYDTYPNKELEKSAKAVYVTLDKLYAESDIISLNCPLNSKTYHIINDDAIAKMKDTVMIINTGRGPLIDTKALIKGLKTRKIGSAGLDVYEEENDYFFEDFSQEVITDDILARLITFNNVLITSHQAFFTQEALLNIATTTLNNIRDFREGKALVNEVCYKCDDNCRKLKGGRCF